MFNIAYTIGFTRFHKLENFTGVNLKDANKKVDEKKL